MDNKMRLINVNPLIEKYSGGEELKSMSESLHDSIFVEELRNAPTVDAVEVEKYMALREMYHELRENFIDYVCSGTCNPAPYCLNRCVECVDKRGWCEQGSDKCRGFNSAEVILMDGGNE